MILFTARNLVKASRLNALSAFTSGGCWCPTRLVHIRSSLLYAKLIKQPQEPLFDLRIVESNLPTPVKRTLFQKISRSLGFQDDLKYHKNALAVAALNLYLCIQYQVDFDVIMKKCDMPDVMYSFCLVTFLHVWLISVALMHFGETGLFVRNKLYENMWKDIEVVLVY
jgi:hypothetical protein